MEITREDWMNAALHELNELVFDSNVELGNVKASCGFPPGSRSKQNYIVYDPARSKGNRWEIFVSPGVADGHEVLRCLTGALNTIYFGDQIAALYDRDGEKLVETLGKYPHEEVTRPPTQPTLMLKCECPSCGYTIRTTNRWLKKGTPQCPWMQCDHYQQAMDIIKKD